MKKNNENKVVKAMDNMMHSANKFLNRHGMEIALMSLFLIFMVSRTVYAADAESMWTTITGLIEKWVGRLGGVVIFVGGVMFGLGWKSDDAEQKTKGIQTIIAGGIVVAVSAVASQFFA